MRNGSELGRTVLLFAILTLTARADALDRQKLISQFSHTAWSADDGIPGPVRAIIQTQDGYLWLGTEAGLYRFDGLRFVLWEPTFGEQLPSYSVWSLCASRDGTLWIGFGSGGIGSLHAGRISIYSSQDGIPSGGVLSIAEGQNGTIWAGGEYGFSEFERGKWHRVGAEVGYPARGAQALLVDRKGNLWVATDGLNSGLSKSPTQRNTILSLAPNAKRFASTGLAVGYIRSIREGPDGSVWIADATAHKAKQISSRRGAIADIVVDGEPWCLLFDRDSSLWVGLIGGGIRRIAAFGQSKISPLERFEPNDGLSGGLVYSTFEDREGNLWVGTVRGLDRFRENKVTSYSVREGLDPDQQVAVTSTKDGSVWIVNYTSDFVHRFQDGKLFTGRLPRFTPAETTRILSVYADGANNVWLGGNFKLANGMDGHFSYILADQIAQGANIEGIAKDAAGGLWITETRWIAEAGEDRIGDILRLRNGQWMDLRKQFSLPEFRCRVLYGDSLGRVWLGFENGAVAVYDEGNLHVYSTKDGLPSGRVLSISSDRAGHIWTGGESGLSRFENGHFKTLTKRNGLPGTSVSGIVEDADGLMWLAGSLGILRVDPKELDKAADSSSYRMQGFFLGANDGLRGLPRQREPFPVVTRASDGRLWFATTGGVAVINTRRLPRNNVPPPVVIENLEADGKSYPALPGLKLRPNTKDLNFRFAGLSLTDPLRNEFRYKLEGYDSDWRGPDTTRDAKYTNLPPRSYTFRVIASNNDGVWNEEGAALEFKILPAFYQTIWFLLLCLAMLGCLTWAAFRWRVHLIATRLDLQFQERLSERTRIARDLHDTLLQSFHGLMLRFQAASNLFPTRPGEAKQTLDSAIDEASQAITEGRDAIEGLRSLTVGINDLAVSLKILGNELAAAQTGQSSPIYHVGVEGRPRDLHPIVRDEIYRIAGEALRNAFRHAQAQQIELEIRYDERHLQLRVRDSGRGMDSMILNEDGRPGHYGLRGMSERAKIFGGKLTIWTKAEAGTEIELTIPASVAYATTPARRGSWLSKLSRNDREMKS